MNTNKKVKFDNDKDNTMNNGALEFIKIIKIIKKAGGELRMWIHPCTPITSYEKNFEVIESNDINNPLPSVKIFGFFSCTIFDLNQITIKDKHPTDGHGWFELYRKGEESKGLIKLSVYNDFGPEEMKKRSEEYDRNMEISNLNVLLPKSRVKMSYDIRKELIEYLYEFNKLTQ